MKITKLGHCCLLVETGGITILTDPGTYTINQVAQFDSTIDIILITHEHSDHYHVPSIRHILEKNPAAIVVTNTSVCELLENEGIQSVVIEDGQSKEVAGVEISGHGTHHALLHESIPAIQNTGFVVNKKLYHPGDAFHVPDETVDILALPVAGPWMNIAEAINFALAVQPKVAFAVHDEVLAQKSGGAFKAPETVLPVHNIEFYNLTNGEQIDFSHV